MFAIETMGLSKSFRNIYAVQDLDLHVPEGSIYGFIGENGSGKSTTEKLICGLLVPTAGDIQLYGKPYTDPGVRARIVVTVTFQEVDNAPNTKTRSKSDYQCLQYIYCAVEKCHSKSLL